MRLTNDGTRTYSGAMKTVVVLNNKINVNDSSLYINNSSFF